jgi:hypothetical protein
VTPVQLPLLLTALRASWDADTAQLWQETWHWSTPARGQCAVSSMIIQDAFGGNLLRGLTSSGIVHYWNELSDGTWVDSTRSQFADDELIVQFQRAPDEYLWRFRGTVERYELLKARVESYLSTVQIGSNG